MAETRPVRTNSASRSSELSSLRLQMRLIGFVRLEPSVWRRIDSGEAIAPLAVNNGRLVLHLVPTSAFGIGTPIDPERAYAAQQLLRPMNSSGNSPRINFDGFANLYHGADGKCWSYAQLFRSGALEAVKVRVVSDLHGSQLLIPTLDFDRWIFERLPDYLSALQRLDVPPPIILMITLQGVRGARLGVADIMDNPPPIDRSVLELPEIVFERYGNEVDYQRTARPAFDTLWNTGGFFRSKHFDDTGAWNPYGR